MSSSDLDIVVELAYRDADKDGDTNAESVP